MFLRYTQQITKEEANEIRRAKLYTKQIDKINSYNFLNRDLEGIKCSSFIFERLSPITLPKFDLLHKLNKVVYENFKGPKKKYTYLKCGGSENGEGAFIFLASAKGYVSNFYLGQFNSSGNSKPWYNHSAKVISSVSRYFYSKFSTYCEIHETLVKKKEDLYKYTGKLFTDDLISLFSVEKLKTLDNFNYSFKEVKPLILDRRNTPRGTILVAQATFHPAEYKLGNYHSVETDFELKLTKNNILIVDVFPKPKNCYKKDATQKLEKIQTNVEILNFLENEISPLIKAIVCEGNFENDIFEKIKSKVLIENI